MPLTYEPAKSQTYDPHKPIDIFFVAGSEKAVLRAETAAAVFEMMGLASNMLVIDDLEKFAGNLTGSSVTIDELKTMAARNGIVIYHNRSPYAFIEDKATQPSHTPGFHPCLTC